jgi:hypothetical protein
MNRRFPVLTTLIVVLICGIPVIAQAQLFDSEREGLLLGIGAGYIAVNSSDYGGSAAGAFVAGKVGYGMSDQLTVILAPYLPSFTPHFGFMYFPDYNSDYYLQGLLGYASAQQDSSLSISGGIGYELRDNVSLELMAGVIRYSDTYTASFNPWTGQTINETSQSNIITIAATFNVHFY